MAGQPGPCTGLSRAALFLRQTYPERGNLGSLLAADAVRIRVVDAMLLP